MIVGAVFGVIGKIAGIDTPSFMQAEMQKRQGGQVAFQTTSEMLEFDKEMEVFKTHASDVSRLVPVYRAKADRVQLKLMTAQVNDLAEENATISRKCQTVSDNDRIRECTKMLKKFNEKAQTFVNFLQR